MIPAHDSPLAAIAFNPTGTKLATASERGTVIRIFSVQDGARLMEFRRGVKRCAHVYSLAFSQESDYLALSSNTETSSDSKSRICTSRSTCTTRKRLGKL